MDKVGPIIVSVRQSVGATVVNEDCIQRRWVSAASSPAVQPAVQPPAYRTLLLPYREHRRPEPPWVSPLVGCSPTAAGHAPCSAAIAATRYLFRGCGGCSEVWGLMRCGLMIKGMSNGKGKSS